MRIRGRPRLPVSSFKSTDKLYRSFDEGDIDPQVNRLKTSSIPFPDLSCNWSRFSEPGDVRLRPGASATDGCYSFTVAVARYKEMANSVHDPEKTGLYENYSHVEIRELATGEDFTVEPPRQRRFKNKARKRLRLEYRQYMAIQAEVELEIAETTE